MDTNTLLGIPKHRPLGRLQDKCPVCNKVAKIVDKKDLKGFLLFTFECGHVEFRESSSTSAFENLIFHNKNPHLCNGKHIWGIGKSRTICTICDARRLFDYQIEGCRAIERADGKFAVLDEQGLGKTIQAIAYLKYNLDTSIPYIWVTKAKILYQHAGEIIDILGDDYFPYILRSSKDKFLEGFKGYMVPWDLWRRFDTDYIQETIKSLGIKLLVLDECQAMKNSNSKRTMAIRDIAKEIPKIIPLSGSFWKNRGSEAFVMLNMLDPKMFWDFASFKRMHVRFVNDPDTGKEKEGGFQNPESFRDLISHIAIRREKKEVLPELPEKNRTKLFCEVPEHARIAYKKASNDLKQILTDAILEGTENSFAIQSKVNESIILLRQIVGLAKVPSIVEYLEEFLENTDKKIIAFVHHIEVGNAIFRELYNFCADNGIPTPIRMLGGMDAQKSMEIRNSFNDGLPRLLIASTLSAGEGLNLQKNCSDVIMCERQWNPMNEEQAEDRVHRIGQNNSCNIVYALGDKTVDTILDKIVHFKRTEFHNSMNKTEMIEWNEQSIFKAMVNALVYDKE